LVRPLGVMPLPVLPVAKGYRIVPWQDDFSDSLGQVAAAAYQDSIESVTVPGDQGRRLIDQLRKTWESEPEHPATDFSQFVLDQRGQLVGYAAVSALNGGAQIVDLAVLPAHRRRGLARVLLVRSMAICQQRNLDAVSVATTTRNPARQLYNQLSFRAVDCGEVAIWWRDGRQLTWRE
jgi:ribosomal protein S18 acetylase RimI-like enzyme